MNSIIAEIERAVGAAKAALEKAASPNEVEAVRIEYLSRNGLFPALSRRMGEVPPEAAEPLRYIPGRGTRFYARARPR